MRFCLLSLAVSSCFAGNALACDLKIDARFIEGAPRDRFEIVNASTGKWAIVGATVDLSSSKGKLIFDTEDGGTGVEVFQPFRGEAGSAKMRRVTKLKDGSDMLTLDFDKFDRGESYTFSIDVDDTLKKSELGQIRVSGSEVRGAGLKFVLSDPKGKVIKAATKFGKNAKARLTGKTCS